MVSRQETALEELVSRFFQRNGYLRIANRAAREDKRKYKKGFEVRLVAANDEELDRIRWLLLQSGFALSQPFVKAGQFVQPIYGRAAVQRFVGSIERHGGMERLNPETIRRLRQPVVRTRRTSP